MSELSGNQKRKMRSASRLYAVQALYQMEITGLSFDRVKAEFLDLRFGAEIDGEELIDGDIELDIELFAIAQVAEDLDGAAVIADEAGLDQGLGVDLATLGEGWVVEDVAQVRDPEVGLELDIGEAALGDAAEVRHLAAFKLMAAGEA